MKKLQNHRVLKLIFLVTLILILSCNKKNNEKSFSEKREEMILSKKVTSENKFLLNNFKIGWKKNQFLEKMKQLEKTGKGKIQDENTFYIYIPDFSKPTNKLSFKIHPWLKNNDSLVGTSISLKGQENLSYFNNFNEIISKKYGQPLLLKIADKSKKTFEIEGHTFYPRFESKSTWIKGNLVIDLTESFSQFKEEKTYFLYIQYLYLPYVKEWTYEILKSRNNLEQEKVKENSKKWKEKDKLDSIRNSIF